MSFYSIRKKTYSISAAVVLLGVIFFFIHGGMNLGLDFMSGTSLHINIGQDFSDEEVRNMAAEIIGEAPIVQKVGDNKTQVMIRSKEIQTDLRDEIFTKLKETYNLTDNDLVEATNVAAGTSTKLFQDATKAIGYSLLLMLIYISIRFELRSGIAATLNLFHNVLILLAVYSIFNIAINTNFVAAILTVVAYSINDTIVVFDRIRENRKKNRRQEFWQITDSSCMQSLKRSIYTSITTLITIGVLYIMGVDAVREFALPIILGIAVGTYASIFLASPMWVMLNDLIKPKKKKLA